LVNIVVASHFLQILGVAIGVFRAAVKVTFILFFCLPVSWLDKFCFSARPSGWSFWNMRPDVWNARTYKHKCLKYYIFL